MINVHNAPTGAITNYEQDNKSKVISPNNDKFKEIYITRASAMQKLNEFTDRITIYKSEKFNMHGLRDKRSPQSQALTQNVSLKLAPLMLHCQQIYLNKTGINHNEIDELYKTFIFLYREAITESCGLITTVKRPTPKLQEIANPIRRTHQFFKAKDAPRPLDESTQDQIEQDWLKRHSPSEQEDNWIPYGCLGGHHYELQFNREVIRKRILQIGNRKAPGWESIPPLIWKRCATSISHILQYIFNICLQHGYTPIQWNYSFTTLIPKSKGAPVNEESYRPIGIGAYGRRLFQLLIWDKLNVTYNITDNFYERQMGFRPKFDCHLAAVNLDNYIKQNPGAVTILLDIRKAFDTVKRRSLQAGIAHVLKDHKYIGLLKCIKSMNHPFTTYTKLVYGEWQSNWINTTKGTIQGDPISPLLFNLAINKALINTAKISNSFFLQAYADDVAISSPDCEILATAIQSLRRHLASIGLALNESKCVSYSVTSHPELAKIPVFKSHPYIGFEFNSLGFDPIQQISKSNAILRRKQALYSELVRICSDFDTAATTNALIYAFKTFLWPSITYGLGWAINLIGVNDPLISPFREFYYDCGLSGILPVNEIRAKQITPAELYDTVRLVPFDLSIDELCIRPFRRAWQSHLDGKSDIPHGLFNTRLQSFIRTFVYEPQTPPCKSLLADSRPRYAIPKELILLHRDSFLTDFFNKLDCHWLTLTPPSITPPPTCNSLPPLHPIPSIELDVPVDRFRYHRDGYGIVQPIPDKDINVLNLTKEHFDGPIENMDRISDLQMNRFRRTSWAAQELVNAELLKTLQAGRNYSCGLYSRDFYNAIMAYDENLIATNRSDGFIIKRKWDPDYKADYLPRQADHPLYHSFPNPSLRRQTMNDIYRIPISKLIWHPPLSITDTSLIADLWNNIALQLCHDIDFHDWDQEIEEDLQQLDSLQNARVRKTRNMTDLTRTGHVTLSGTWMDNHGLDSNFRDHVTSELTWMDNDRLDSTFEDHVPAQLNWMDNIGLDSGENSRKMLSGATHNFLDLDYLDKRNVPHNFLDPPISDINHGLSGIVNCGLAHEELKDVPE